jgi:alkane 1-monooxygenase
VIANPFLYYYIGYLLLPVWVGYALLPFLDYIFGHDETNVSKESERYFEEDVRFLLPMYTLFFCDFVLYIWTLYIFLSGEANVLQMFILILNAAHSNGLTGLMGHELFHRRHPIHKLVGTITLCKFFYGHFVNEHVLGHHINV